MSIKYAYLPLQSFSSVKKPATPSSQAVEKNAGHHRPSYKSPKLEARKSFVANFQSVRPGKGCDCNNCAYLFACFTDHAIEKGSFLEIAKPRKWK
jgi:hypothetical protein